MPEEAGQPPRESPTLRQDALVETLRPSPTDPPPDVVQLYGFLGRDTEDGYWRLYLSADLDTYLRIVEADIVACRPGDPERTSLDPSLVIVRASAKVDQVQTVPLDIQASFLRGAYTAALSAARSAAVVAEVMNPHLRRARRSVDPLLRYPQTNSYCQPQVTIEQNTCFCTIFCPQ